MTSPLTIIIAIIIVTAALFGAMAHIAKAQDTMPTRSPTQTGQDARSQNHPYLGMWVTADGHIRQELLPNGRYDEARGSRKSAYQGRYVVTGTHIDYWDDTGFTADGTFDGDNVLHHGGMIFHREK